MNDPRLESPTAKQISVTLRSVLRSIAAGPFEPARQQVAMWGLAERAPEFTAELRAATARHDAGQIRER